MQSKNKTAKSKETADYGHNIEGLIYQELMVRLTGPDIFPQPENTGTIAAQALSSGPAYGTENFQRLVVSLLHDAQEKIVITTPYFIPDEAFIQAMQTAVLSGVDVTLIVSSKVDQKFVGLAQSAYYEELLKVGVKIYLYQSALLHAKHMSVDDTVAFIGSGNMDKHSFDLNFEITMLFYNAQVVEALKAEEAQYLEGALQLTYGAWRQRSAKDKFWQNLAKLFSPLL